MLLLILVGLLKATLKDNHKDIKILTEDREYELRLANPKITGESLMFVKTTPYNNRTNIFRYDPVNGGIQTMFNDFLSRNIESSGDSQHIRPQNNQTAGDDWLLSGVGSSNRIKNSKNVCLKIGKRLSKVDTEAFELLGVPCTLSDKDQNLVIVEIPRDDIDVCKLLQRRDTNCASDRFLETMTDVKSLPNLT